MIWGSCRCVLSSYPRGDPVISWSPLHHTPVSEMKTMHNVRPVDVIAFTNLHPRKPLPFSLYPRGEHMLANLHTHTHSCARCGWVTGSGINVIPCWWLKSVDNRDVSKGDQSRLAQDTAGGLFGLPVINTGCYLGVGTLTSPRWGNTGSAISME